jgi:hypothetical protein
MKTAKYFFIIFALAFTNIYASSAKPAILPAYKNPTPGEFPILGWYSIPDSASTRQRYNEMREAGFNISFSHFTDNAQISRAAKACRGTGIKIIAGSPQLEASTKESIDSLKQYGEIAGWFLRDEPVVSGFGYHNSATVYMLPIQPDLFTLTCFPEWLNQKILAQPHTTTI